MRDSLWLQLLEIAEGRDTGARPTAGDLAWHEITGWRLRDSPGSGDIPSFALYKPLLDAASRGQGCAIAQLGQSLDGCIATRAGDACYINGPELLDHLHRLRALSDAVIVGAGTVAADNPRLTTRKVAGRNPTRVVLDPDLRLADRAGHARAFDGAAPTLWVCDARHRADAEAKAGRDRVLAIEGLCDHRDSMNAALVVEVLRTRGLRRLFVEGGGVTVSRFLAQRCLDRLHLSVAPVLIGDGRRGLQFEGAVRLSECRRPPCSIVRFGDDMLWDLDTSAG